MSESVIVAALYKFVTLDDFHELREPLLDTCLQAGIRGTLLLAREGINGTIAGSRNGIDAVLAQIRTLPGCSDIEHKESRAPEIPFNRLKVRLKREIVTMGVEDIDPAGLQNSKDAGKARYRTFYKQRSEQRHPHEKSVPDKFALMGF